MKPIKRRVERKSQPKHIPISTDIEGPIPQLWKDQRIGDIFPHGNDAAPCVVTLMVRLDDLRLAYARFNELTREPDSDDTSIEFFSLVRWMSICIDDARAALKGARGKRALKPYFQGAAGPHPEWKPLTKQLDQARQTLNMVRNKVSALLDYESIARALSIPDVANVRGTIELGDKQGRYRFPIASGVIANTILNEPDVLHRASEDKLAASSEEELLTWGTARPGETQIDRARFGLIIDALSSAYASVLTLSHIVIAAHLDSVGLLKVPSERRQWKGRSHFPEDSSIADNTTT